MNNRGSNIARGWSYSQQSNLYLKKAALYSLENPRILWSCQPLISKGSLADRDLDLHMELVKYGFDTRYSDIKLYVITLRPTPTFLWGIWIIDVVWSYVLILHLKKKWWVNTELQSWNLRTRLLNAMSLQHKLTLFIAQVKFRHAPAWKAAKQTK